MTHTPEELDKFMEYVSANVIPLINEEGVIEDANTIYPEQIIGMLSLFGPRHLINEAFICGILYERWLNESKDLPDKVKLENLLKDIKLD